MSSNKPASSQCQANVADGLPRPMEQQQPGEGPAQAVSNDPRVTPLKVKKQSVPIPKLVGHPLVDAAKILKKQSKEEWLGRFTLPHYENLVLKHAQETTDWLTETSRMPVKLGQDIEYAKRIPGLNPNQTALFEFINKEYRRLMCRRVTVAKADAALQAALRKGAAQHAQHKQVKQASQQVPVVQQAQASQQVPVVQPNLDPSLEPIHHFFKMDEQKTVRVGDQPIRPSRGPVRRMPAPEAPVVQQAQASQPSSNIKGLAAKFSTPQANVQVSQPTQTQAPSRSRVASLAAGLAPTLGAIPQQVPVVQPAQAPKQVPVVQQAQAPKQVPVVQQAQASQPSSNIKGLAAKFSTPQANVQVSQPTQTQAPSRSRVASLAAGLAPTLGVIPRQVPVVQPAQASHPFAVPKVVQQTQASQPAGADFNAEDFCTDNEEILEEIANINAACEGAETDAALFTAANMDSIAAALKLQNGKVSEMEAAAALAYHARFDPLDAHAKFSLRWNESGNVPDFPIGVDWQGNCMWRELPDGSGVMNAHILVYPNQMKANTCSSGDPNKCFLVALWATNIDWCRKHGYCSPYDLYVKLIKAKVIGWSKRMLADEQILAIAKHLGVAVGIYNLDNPAAGSYINCAPDREVLWVSWSARSQHYISGCERGNQFYTPNY
jgi:hypothetical protein